MLADVRHGAGFGITQPRPISPSVLRMTVRSQLPAAALPVIRCSASVL